MVTPPGPEQEAGAEWQGGCRSVVNLIRTGGDFLINCGAKEREAPEAFLFFLYHRPASYPDRRGEIHHCVIVTRHADSQGRSLHERHRVFVSALQKQTVGSFLRKPAAVCVSFPMTGSGPVESAGPFIRLESVLPVVALAPGSSGALIAKTSIINGKLFL